MGVTVAEDFIVLSIEDFPVDMLWRYRADWGLLGKRYIVERIAMSSHAKVSFFRLQTLFAIVIHYKLNYHSLAKDFYNQKLILQSLSLNIYVSTIKGVLFFEFGSLRCSTSGIFEFLAISLFSLAILMLCSLILCNKDSFS